ncbi:MAG: copper amine oxidase N-terminal domain-containing protein [Anaerotignaceae bacterium]
MKKKIALLLSAIMVVGMIPATAFATTTNTVSKIITGSEDGLTYTIAGTTAVDSDMDTAPIFKITDKDLNDVGATTSITFKATLTNADFSFVEDAADKTNGVIDFKYDGMDISVDMLSDNMAMITAQINKVDYDDYTMKFPIAAELTDDGDATITIDAMDSIITSGTYKFANVVSGATSTTIEKKVDVSEAGKEIKPIIITETAKGSMDYDSKGLKLKVSNGFTFAEGNATKATAKVYAGAGAAAVTTTKVTVDEEEMYIYLSDFSGATGAMTISITGVTIEYDEDDVEVGDIAEITISGYDMTKATIEVGVAKTFGVDFTAESKTLPVFYSGRRDAEVDSLKVTMEEVISNSWLENRKTTITFPEGVKIISVTPSVEGGGVVADYNVENNELTIEEVTKTGDAEIEFEFQLSIAPDFTGDITATLGGSGVEEDVEAVIGTAVAPVTVEADSNPVSIDYRNVAIGDIIITEAYAGALEKDKTLTLKLEDNYLDFDGTPTVEVVEGDIKIEDVDTSEGLLQIEIDSASSKAPAVLKVTGVELYLDRTIPAGSYALQLTAGETYSDGKSELVAGTYGTENYDAFDESEDAFFQNSATKGDDYKKTTLFDTRSITVLDDYVEVVTAGRDQGDDTFTTTISVAIGADKLVAGTSEIALDVPAYIANGYTMLPVRAITEALSSVAIVRWDDATDTVTITFGSRVISMTVGSKTMNINGVAVQMQASCEITDSRAFIPLRDLGYALGLNDNKITWDDATKTATLN